MAAVVAVMPRLVAADSMVVVVPLAMLVVAVAVLCPLEPPGAALVPSPLSQDKLDRVVLDNLVVRAGISASVAAMG